MQSFCFSRKKLAPNQSIVFHMALFKHFMINISMLPSGSLKINVSEIIQAYPFLKQIRR